MNEGMKDWRIEETRRERFQDPSYKYILDKLKLWSPLDIEDEQELCVE